LPGHWGARVSRARICSCLASASDLHPTAKSPKGGVHTPCCTSSAPGSCPCTWHLDQVQGTTQAKCPALIPLAGLELGLPGDFLEVSFSSLLPRGESQGCHQPLLSSLCSPPCCRDDRDSVSPSSLDLLLISDQAQLPSLCWWHRA
jgi:hypothetical protein